MPFSYGRHKEKVLPKGYYRALVLGAKPGVSRSAGNDMLTIKLEIQDPDNPDERIIVYDYLVDVTSLAWKSKQFAQQVGQDPELGVIDEEAARGHKVWIMLTPETDAWGTKNRVTRYGKAESDKNSPPAAGPASESDADVPF